MDAQDHKKATSSEHDIHGVYVCRKCGWPFPNPHPSAKHRRAHKRVCGTIEAYKLIDSGSDHANLAGSDNEHLSDDEQRTPSPKVGKGSIEELGSSGAVGLKSIRSEDEFFSDAVTEFSDNGVSPSFEDRLENVKQLDKNVGAESLHDLKDGHVSKYEKTADTNQPLHGPTQLPQGPGKASEMSDSDVMGSVRNQSEVTKSISDIGTENVSVGVSSKNSLESDSSRVVSQFVSVSDSSKNSLESDSSQIVSQFVSVSDNSTTDSEIGNQKELISSGPGTDIKEKEKSDEAVDVHNTASSEVLQSEHKLEIEPKMEEIQGKSSGHVALEAMVLGTDKESSDPHVKPDLQSKLNNVNGETSHAGIVDEIVDQEKELTNDLQSKHEVSSQIEPSKFDDVLVVSEVKSDSAKNLIRSSHGQSDEVRDLTEVGNEDTHLLSAAKTLPAVENPEVMIGDFKDYEVLKSSFHMDLGAAEEIRSTEDHEKVPVPEIQSALSNDSTGSEDNSFSDALDDNLEKEGISTRVDGEVGISVPHNLPSALSSVPAGTVDNSSSDALKDDLREVGVSTPLRGEVGNPVPENIPSSHSSVPAGNLDNSSEALENDLKKAGFSAPIDGEFGTSVPENLPSALSSVPAGTLDNSSSEALEDDVKKGGVSTPIDVEVGTFVPQNLPSALSSVLARTEDKFSSEALEDDLKMEGVLTPIDGEISTSVPESLPTALSSVPAGTVENSKKEAVSTPIDGEAVSSGFRVTSDEGTHLLSVAETFPAVENPEAMIGDFKDYKVLKSSFSLDLPAAEVISTEDDKKVTVPSGSVDNSSSDTLEDDLNKKEGISIPIDGEVGTSGFWGKSDEDTLLSMVETSPAVENPEVRIGDLKDYRVLKSSFPLDLGAAEEIRSVENDKKVTVPETLPSALSNVPSGSVDNSSSDALEDDLKKEGVSSIPIDGEVGASGFRVTGDADLRSGLRDLPKTSGSETNNSQPNKNLEGSLPKCIHGNSLQNEDSEPTTREHSDVIPLESSTAEQTWQTGGENADNHGTDELISVASENGNVQAGDELSPNITTTQTHGETLPETIEKSISLTGDDSLGHEISTMGLSSIAGNETEKVAAEEKLVKHVDATHESTEKLTNSASLDKASGSNQVDLRDSGKFCNYSESPKCSDEIRNASEGLKMDDETEVPRSSGTPGLVSQPEYEDSTVPSEKTSENLSSKEMAALPMDSASVEYIKISGANVSGPMLDVGEDKVTKQNFSVPVVDNSVVSSSRTNSLEGNWGSASVLSSQSDVTAVGDAEVLSSTDTQTAEKLDGDFKKRQGVATECHPEMSDVYEPPSFMTLVEPRFGVDKNADASEIQTAQRDEQAISEALRAGWFPSVTNVVNESEGRKKNEEIIAKVTNWSTGKQHSPLKNLLSEAQAETKVKSPNTKQVPAVKQADENASKNNGTSVTTVSSILGSEMPSADTVKKEMEKEWNSPARYPIQIKKEKRKGKPYWVPFVCCTSVHQDL